MAARTLSRLPGVCWQQPVDETSCWKVKSPSYGGEVIGGVQGRGSYSAHPELGMSLLFPAASELIHPAGMAIPAGSAAAPQLSHCKNGEGSARGPFQSLSKG